MPHVSRGPGFWLQPSLIGQKPVIDPDPDTCHCCQSRPAVGYVEVFYHGTTEWYWRYGVCQLCLDRYGVQPDPGSLTLYEVEALPEPVIEPVVVEVEVNAKGQCLLF